MKKLIYFLALLITSAIVHAQNVGIGTTTPLARLHVTDSNVIFTAPTVTTAPASFTTPVNGAGTRMMWLPKKSAFRVGSITGANWDADSIGLYSFASGYNAKAKGYNSTAMGNNTLANGGFSTALGDNTVANGNASTAIGYQTIASGTNSIAIGERAVATGYPSTSIGYHTVASGDQSTAIGGNTAATAQLATAMGFFTTASGLISTAMGRFTIASGSSSTAMGVSTTANGDNSTSMGNFTVASGEESTAMGYGTRATGSSSTSLGYFVTARAFAAVALGQYNDSVASSNLNTWIAADPLLILGNGTSPSNRRNAMVVYKNGNADLNGFTRLGEITDGAPRIKTKKITGYNTPNVANTFIFIPHGLDRSKILSINAIVDASGYDILPHSPNAGFIYTINTDPNGGAAGPSIAVGVLSSGQSSAVMNKAIKIFITYEE